MITVATARLQTEAFWGSAWFHNPARWGTADGYVPYRVLWAYWHAMESARALKRLDQIRAGQIVRAGEAARGALETELSEAYPRG